MQAEVDCCLEYVNDKDDKEVILTLQLTEREQIQEAAVSLAVAKKKD